LCPRLASFRDENRALHPDWHNNPVPSFGDPQARLLVVGLAPGLKGANRTGRPFTGDYAGELLYESLIDFGFAKGPYLAEPADGLELHDCLITNAVRCVPPQNKPTPEEASTCRQFLEGQIAALPGLKAVIALGRVAHDATLRALGAKLSAHAFSHGAEHALISLSSPLVLFDSFHCSRYNTNTGRLTREMFRTVIAAARAHLDTR